jgi:tripartite-type tricarboxylate transporter receptor subunit TctC
MTTISRRMLLAGAALSIALPARAQTWPQRPVMIVVPQPAGNSPDILCRVIAEKLSRDLGQQFVVDNRPGAANLVGTQAVARAAPDGHTFLFATSAALVTNPFTFKSLPYDPMKDLVPVALMARSNHVLLVHPDVKATTLPALIALERKAPGTFSLGVDGPRNLTGLLAQAINKYGPAEFILVPYNKTSQAVQDTVTGRIQATLQSASVAEPFIKEGSLRPIAVAGSRRIASLPDVQSISETLKSVDLQGWFMMMAPAGTPPDVVQKLSAEIDRILQEPDMQERARVLGFQIDSGKAASPSDARQFLETEFATSGRVIKELGIEPE